MKIENGVLAGGTEEGRSVVIPQGVTEIGDKAFMRNKKIARVVIPEGVVRIGESAFYGCTALKSVILPKSLEEIGREAFGGCFKLKRIEIPQNVTRIGNCAFYDCRSLKFVAWNARACDSVGEFREIPKLDDYADETSFLSCNKLKEAAIGDGVISLPAYAFHNCKALARITVGKGLAYSSAYAFDGTRHVKKVIYTGDEESWGKIVFDGYAASPVGDGTALYIGGKCVRAPQKR